MPTVEVNLAYFRRMFQLLWFSLALFATTSVFAQSVVKLSFDHAVGPASSEYLEKGLAFAKNSNASAVLIELDTPGGLESAMRVMMQNIATSPIPVLTYVSPSGARAASAGVFLLYASPVAAMAPGTHLGAATPVTLGGQGDDANAEAMRKKILNDAVASIRSFAELYGRNADWGEKAVREGVSLSSEEALRKNVIDYLALDTSDLLTQVNNTKVLVNHEWQTLNTEYATIVEYAPDWRTQLLLVISDPSIAYLLLMAGVTALFLEFAYAGTGVPGVIGVVSIILALYGLQMLPVDYTGLMLIIVGFILIGVEALVSSMGFFALLGVIALFFGSIMLIDSDQDVFHIVRPVLFSILALAGSLAWLLASMAVRSHRKELVSGLSYLIGQRVVVQQDHQGRTFVFLGGERWKLDHHEKVTAGDRVEVTGFSGLTVLIKSLEDD